jgi:hypothetical protein
MPENMGASTSRIPTSLHGLYKDNFTLTYIKAPESISTAYFINPSHQVCVSMYHLSLLGNTSVKGVIAASNIIVGYVVLYAESS